MSGTLNKVMLIGHLGQDPEVRSMQSGDKVCNLSLATEESWKDSQSGERKTRTQWHRVVIFGPLVKVAESYARKGAKVYVEGQMETRSYTDAKDVNREVTEVVLRPFNGTFNLLDRKPGNADSEEPAEEKATA
ncbi:single-stranded DNA-binding protein [Marinibaculum pumilum]|uniref:Single-stranded DNA-binding protein n=1 Tax=Marinibaculum pumilum TaxID=1766165 RepID=A0ABV7L739_9PROT